MIVNNVFDYLLYVEYAFHHISTVGKKRGFGRGRLKLGVDGPSYQRC